MAEERTLDRPFAERPLGESQVGESRAAEGRLTGGRSTPVWLDALGIASIVSVFVALYLALLWAPTEATMGDIQRIFYFHVPSAWLALGPSFTVVLIGSILYLVKKDLKYDRLAAASAEIGVMFTTITLVTGPIWARPVWGAYWTWEPRLTTTLVLWFIFVAYLMLRASTSGHRRARLSAVFGIVGWVDVPIVFMAIRWWRTIHPTVFATEGGGLDSSMTLVLMISLAAFTLLYVYLLVVRFRQENLADRLDRLRHRVYMR